MHDQTIEAKYPDPYLTRQTMQEPKTGKAHPPLDLLSGSSFSETGNHTSLKDSVIGMFQNPSISI